MKLRFDKNSIRLRLKKSDIKKLLDQNLVEEKIHFPNGEFSYHLSVSNQVKEISATAKTSSIEVMIPSVALPWTTNEEVGLYHTIHLSNHTLDIAIEKDF